MNKALKIILLVLAVGISLAMILNGSSSRFSEVWMDDFSGDKIDETKWTIETGNGCPNLCGFGNNEAQYYTDEQSNIRIEDGMLIIEAHKTNDPQRPFTSGKLITKHKADWRYGKIEMKAKLPKGKGTWPAFWMLPTFKDGSMKWPLDGEIDIMEHVGFNQGMIYGTIHTQKYNGSIGTQKSDSLFIRDAHSSFHVYGIEWSPSEISWYIDDQKYLTLKKNDDDYTGWPFDENEYHLILNLAVGGNWGGRMGIDEGIWPQQYVIDYVKYYKLEQ